MIDLKTWHPKDDKQKCFAWCATESGIQIHHSVNNPSYIIPWGVFYSVLKHSLDQSKAKGNDGVVIVGTSMTNPSQNSIGAWVKGKNFKINNGTLTPKHLSFLGPIYGQMGFIKRQIKGGSILWSFKL